MTHTGTVHQINLSTGGVPKLAVDAAELTETGFVGDVQKDTKHHGGPMRAVCLYSLELIERLRAEGHPIEPGTTGENLTLAGVDWSVMVPGTRLLFDGGIELELTSYAEPCSTIRESFEGSEFRRIKQELHPGESRVYAKVVSVGTVAAGAGVRVG